MASRINRLGSGNVVNTTYLPATYEVRTYKREEFCISNPGVKSFSLSLVPIKETEDVKMNGLLLSIGSTNDYTIIGNTLVLNPEIELTVGDIINIKYLY